MIKKSPEVWGGWGDFGVCVIWGVNEYKHQQGDRSNFTELDKLNKMKIQSD
jgi:hypothetical protein